jgi:hypothetical protein
MIEFDGWQVADALADPASVFANPQAVVSNEQLTTGDKLEILEQWREQEKMKLAEHPDDVREGRLRAVTQAIDELTL